MGSMDGGLGCGLAFYYRGQVSTSRLASHCRANWRDSPHISGVACRPAQQAGRCGWVKIRQRKSVLRCTQGSPAGLASELIDGAMQQAPQPGRQVNGASVMLAGGLALDCPVVQIGALYSCKK